MPSDDVHRDPRGEPPGEADERTMLTAFLDFQRETLALKCAGLTPIQLRQWAVPPSSLSLLGLVRHLAEVERGWFRCVLLGEADKPHWAGPRGEGYAQWDVDDADVEEAFRVWRAECDRSRATVAGAASLDVAGSHDGRPYSLRHILTHMIEEYARHNGHADLLRERIDGVTGE
ncbi:DinB family protein [Streptomyces aureocirculatus]|uniref:DinB family protein n=1 Tax=Streptomyces aureocirculatus TaxID=67275 RepID=UPI0004C9595B|nr:DinB family protein [Streptomyces aureocirculatus]